MFSLGGITIGLSVECETCGNTVVNHVTTLDTLDGIPVVDVSLVVSQEEWICSLCGSATYTGDLEDIMYVEGGEDPSEYEYDPDEEEDEEY